MISILAFLFVIGFLVFVHELGHFLAARKVGIRVETFSLGFGPRLFGVKRGDTDYRVSLIPFGGYVKMAGEDPTASAGQNDELPSKSIPQRFLVYVSGAMMNLIVAIFFSILLAYIGFYVPAYTVQPPAVGWIEPDSSAAQAGLRTDDLIQMVNGVKVDTWEEVIQKIFLNPDQSSKLNIIRGSESLKVDFTPGELSTSNRFGGLSFRSSVIVGDIKRESPAEKAGIKIGDKIVQINEESITAIEQLQYHVQNSNGQPVGIRIDRENTALDLTISPEMDPDAGVYLIGITFKQPDRVLKKYGLIDSVKTGLVTNYEMSLAMLDLVVQLVSGEASLKNLGGPIMIGVLAGEAAKSGIRDLLTLTSFISLNLAILNLLPIPVLDGGLILFLLIEMIRRKPLSEKIQIILQNTFFFLLISVAIIVSYHDILLQFR